MTYRDRAPRGAAWLNARRRTAVARLDGFRGRRLAVMLGAWRGRRVPSGTAPGGLRSATWCSGSRGGRAGGAAGTRPPSTTSSRVSWAARTTWLTWCLPAPAAITRGAPGSGTGCAAAGMCLPGRRRRGRPGHGESRSAVVPVRGVVVRAGHVGRLVRVLGHDPAERHEAGDVAGVDDDHVAS